jgi:hypothetical protein
MQNRSHTDKLELTCNGQALMYATEKIADEFGNGGNGVVAARINAMQKGNEAYRKRTRLEFAYVQFRS